MNTTAAETLYSGIGDLIDADPTRTTLVDVCCGTGSIGLTLAKRFVKYVYMHVYTYPGVCGYSYVFSLVPQCLLIVCIFYYSRIKHPLGEHCGKCHRARDNS